MAVGVQDGIRKPEELIKGALKGDIPVYQSGSTSPAANQNEEKTTNPIYRHLMNGVSFMVPFIVVGGLLIGGCTHARRREDAERFSHPGRFFLENH
ncbi:hypothetical protein P7F88_10995 [Vibrio hannami]|nr:hypothetical protein [Vibrio hannami]MDG3086610.1 hypothetical protein [Vibrio hannami]